jgi:hypothetical protein
VEVRARLSRSLCARRVFPVLQANSLRLRVVVPIKPPISLCSVTIMMAVTTIPNRMIPTTPHPHTYGKVRCLYSICTISCFKERRYSSQLQPLRLSSHPIACLLEWSTSMTPLYSRKMPVRTLLRATSSRRAT